jgi:hypothetical protein
MNNKPLNLEELTTLMGKDIWMIMVDRSFGGRRKLVEITEDKIWVDNESYLDIEDLNVIMEIYLERPACYDEINKGSIG